MTEKGEDESTDVLIEHSGLQMTVSTVVEMVSLNEGSRIETGVN